MPRPTKANLKKKKKLEAKCFNVSYASLSKKREDGVTSAVVHNHASFTHPDAGTCHDIVDSHMSFSQYNDGGLLLLDGPKKIIIILGSPQYNGFLTQLLPRLIIPV
jgi:hypothetical protein